MSLQFRTECREKFSQRTELDSQFISSGPVTKKPKSTTLVECWAQQKSIDPLIDHVSIGMRADAWSVYIYTRVDDKVVIFN